MEQNDEGNVRVERLVRRDLGFEECPNCGGHDLEVTSEWDAPVVADGDRVVCRECKTEGSISLDSETDPYVNWDV